MTVLPPASVAVDRVLVEEDVARCGQAVTNYTLSSIGADGATVGIIQSTVPSHFFFCCLCQETPDLTPTNALLLSVCHCCCYLVCMYVYHQVLAMGESIGHCRIHRLATPVPAGRKIQLRVTQAVQGVGECAQLRIRRIASFDHAGCMADLRLSVTREV